MFINLADSLPPGRRGTDQVRRALTFTRFPFSLLDGPFEPQSAITSSLSLSEGKSTGPPEAARFLPLATEAGFPPLLEVGVFLPQLEVGWFPP